ncbi:tetratricopeptide repeat protein [Desulfocurvus sp. DL9XJH121]
MQDTALYNTICLISGVEDHLRRDKFNLSRIRAGNIKAYSTGHDALEYLEKASVDCILLDTELLDMDGFELLRALRQTPLHRKTPIIMVTVANKKDSVLDAVDAGCTGYVLRPYSEETLKRHLVMAKQLERFSEIEEEQLRQAQDMVEQGDFDDAIEEFEEILTVQDEARKYYDMGCDYLLRQKYGKAIIAFNKALKINDLYAEAYQGLAKAYKGKGNIQKYANYLQKAAEVHAQFDRMDQAKTLFIEVLKHDNQAPNPYNTWGVQLRRQGDYPGAVQAYNRALELTPKDENIHFNLSKAYFFMGDRKKAESALKKALRTNGDFPEALKFFSEVTGEPWPGPVKPKDETAAPAMSVIDV